MSYSTPRDFLHRTEDNGTGKGLTMVMMHELADGDYLRADLVQFKVGFVVVTWGPADVVRTWSKQLHRAVKWPILWDKTGALCKKFGFGSGLAKLWAAENLDFLGCQRAMHSRPVEPPPTDLNWLDWCQIGGEAVIARPVCWDPDVVKSTFPNTEVHRPTNLKRPRKTDENPEEDDADERPPLEENLDVEVQSKLDRDAVRSGETKVCVLHQSSFVSDLLPSGAIYQAALTAFAHLQNTTEALVMDRIRQNRRFSTAPESARLQYEATSGLYYDPETLLYYDSARGYFYDSSTHMYYYWSESEHRYIPANTLIQAEIASTQAAQLAAAQVAAARAATEREAARRAAMRVAAELAEIRAAKDDYAAYVYATCVAPQNELTNTNITSLHRNTTAAANNIEASMKAWDPRHPEPLVPYTDDATNDSTTPPPPGL